MKRQCIAVFLFMFSTVEVLAQTQPPATPNLISPPNGALGVPRIFLQLKWDSVANASRYHVQVALDSTFTSGLKINDSTLTATTRSAGFNDYSTVYFWRVRAINAAGASAFSAPWKFKTTLPTPSLIAPGSDATGVDTITAFTWNAVAQATWYRLQLSRDSLFQTVERDTNVGPATYVLISGLQHDTYYWWRVAANSGDILNVWSSQRKFRTIGLGPRHGSASEARYGLLTGNNIEVGYYNFGEFADWMNRPWADFVWPKGSDHTYIDGTAFIVQARAYTDSGKVIHPLETNFYEYTRHDNSGFTYGWWPVPGYAMSGQAKVAISDDPSSWPTHWPDKPGDWDGQWNGFLGKGVRDSLTETYYVMDDNADREYLPHFRPDSTDTTRGGLGVKVSGRAMEWRWPKLRDVLFLSFQIYNEGTTLYDSMFAAQYIDFSIGGHDNSASNYATYLPSAQLFIVRSTALYGLPGNWSPIGMVGVLGISTPDSNGITGVRTTVIHNYDLNNDERNWTLLSAHGVTLENTIGLNGVGFLSSGPFSLAPGQEKQLLLAYIFALDTTDLMAKAEIVRQYARSGFDDHILDVYDAGTVLPGSFALEQNYPNPFNPSTTIGYALPHRSRVTLTVFNMLGQKVTTLVSGEVEAGYHEVQFNASGLASGVYFYRLQAGAYVQTRRLCLIK